MAVPCELNEFDEWPSEDEFSFDKVLAVPRFDAGLLNSYDDSVRLALYSSLLAFSIDL